MSRFCGIILYLLQLILHISELHIDIAAADAPSIAQTGINGSKLLIALL